MILHGDCREHMAAMEPNSVDAIVTDPPYGLSFMGKGWDKGVPGVAFWAEMLRVLKPGGHLLAFGGTRTFHRMAVAIEDAGFEIKDTLSWLYGSGFPKHKSLLKPAWEPIILARKRGAAVLNIDACRLGDGSDRVSGGKAGAITVPLAYGVRGGGIERPTGGRWPANVVLDEDAAAVLDQMSGERRTGGQGHSGESRAGYSGGWKQRVPGNIPDTGGASRFFYVAKASRSERNAGLEGMPERTRAERDGRQMGNNSPLSRNGSGKPVNGTGMRNPVANHHPTVKPLSLMRWLVRLVTPPGGVVLDPFAGSGSTGCAAALEGFDCILIEQEAEYVEIAERRVAHWKARGVQLEIPA